MNRLFKILLSGIAGIILLFVIMGFFGYRMLTQSLPQTEGRLTGTAVIDSVRIYRNHLHVPCVISRNKNDTWFAQGFVTAGDRLWQMHFLRLYAGGRLHQLFGGQAIESDSLARIPGFSLETREMLQSLDPDLIGVFNSYTDGVNEAMRQLQGSWPVEFLLMNAEPDPWTPEDCLTIFNWLLWTSAHRWTEPILLNAIHDQIGRSKYQRYFHTLSIDSDWTEALTSAVADTQFCWFDHPFGRFSSFHKAISDSAQTRFLTALQSELMTPALWYEINLFEKDSQYCGLTLPGVPLIIAGHYDHLAWSLAECRLPDIRYSQTAAHDTSRMLAPGLSLDWPGNRLTEGLRELWHLHQSQWVETPQQTPFFCVNMTVPMDSMTQILMPGRSRNSAMLTRYASRTNSGSSILNDVYSPVHSRFLSVTLPVMQSNAALDSAGKEMIRHLRQWDKRVSKGSEAALFVSLWQQALIQDAFEQDLGPHLYNALLNHPGLTTEALLNRIDGHHDHLFQKWLIRGFNTALEQSRGDSWGSRHQIVHSHILGGHPLLAPSLNAGPHPAAGDATTLSGIFMPPGSDHFAMGPAARCVCTAEKNQKIQIEIMISTGQSGHPFSPHYKDQMIEFNAGRLHACLPDKNKLIKTGWPLLQLIPGDAHE